LKLDRDAAGLAFAQCAAVDVIFAFGDETGELRKGKLERLPLLPVKDGPS
jgi:hypothetical protein